MHSVYFLLSSYFHCMYRSSARKDRQIEMPVKTDGLVNTKIDRKRRKR